MEPLEHRKEDFRNRLRVWCDMNDPDCVKFPVWLRKDFWEYWTDTNDNGRKMYFEMEKKWNTGLRLATWKRNTHRDPRWKSKPQPVHQIITQTDIDYEPPEVDYNSYKERISGETGRGNIGQVLKEKIYK